MKGTGPRYHCLAHRALLTLFHGGSNAAVTGKGKTEIGAVEVSRTSTHQKLCPHCVV